IPVIIAYAALVPILFSAGYRVLLYDLYGRGYSDTPQGVPYDAKLYVCYATRAAPSTRKIGAHSAGGVQLTFSMGGPIAAAFVVIFPELVERDVVLIASTGVRIQHRFTLDIQSFSRLRFLSQFHHLPFVERFVMNRMLAVSTPRDLRSSSNIVRLQAAHLPGFRHAVVSSLHEGPITRMRWAFEAKSWKTGATRSCVSRKPFHHSLQPALKSFIKSVKTDSAPGDLEVVPLPRVELVHIPSAGHDLTLTHPDEVGHALVSFFDA
ncbi:Alpha/Beta hydrolase protein, partial [Mycena latifolia]